VTRRTLWDDEIAPFLAALLFVGIPVLFALAVACR
jgi:hypothetical protein